MGTLCVIILEGNQLQQLQAGPYTAVDLQRGIELARDDVLVQNVAPVLVYGCLTIANETYTLLHDRADVDMVCKPDVVGYDATPAAFLHGHDHLVQDLGYILL